MPERMYQLLAYLGEGGITNGTCILLVLIFIVGLRDKRFGRICPSLMTSLGILGTFCGIYLSLYPLDFSPGKMNDSVTQLLGGMRTAFFTSLAGIGASIAFKVIESKMSPRNIDDNIKKQMTPEQQLVIEKLEGIRQAISGDGDSSLVTQLQYIRNDNREAIQKLDQLTETIRGALIESLKDLTKEVREVIVEQLKKSLEQLISRIEKALIDQFGKTFIEFNQATQSIKKWQEDNRDHITQLTMAFDLSAEQIRRIAEDCRTIPATMESLSSIMKVVEKEVIQLQRHLESFAKLREQAEDAFPLIKKHLDKIGEDLAHSANAFSGLKEVIRDTFEDAQKSIKLIGEQHLANVNEVANAMTQSMKEESKKSSLQIQELVKETLKEFGERLSGESLRIARGYGDNMVSIAEQCARAIERSAKGGNNHG